LSEHELFSQGLILSSDGIAGAFTLSLLNYLLLGFTFPVDGYYMRSWEMWLAVTIVFVGAGNIGITMLDYRLYHKNLVRAVACLLVVEI